MTENEAREILLAHLKKLAWRDFPNVWIGDIISHDELGFSFKANIYAEGANPEADWVNWGVDANTGICMPAYM